MPSNEHSARPVNRKKPHPLATRFLQVAIFLVHGRHTGISLHLGTVSAGEGFPAVIVNRNAPAFYRVSARAYESLLEPLENLEKKRQRPARSSSK